VKISPLRSHWKINDFRNISKLSFLNKSSSVEIQTKLPVDHKKLDDSGKNGERLDQVSAAMGIIGTISLVISFLSVSAPSGPIINIIKLFKLLYR